jgi:chemotaxis protein CheX
VQLAQILDLGAAAPLKQALLAARGAPIAIDASQVERFGALCLQVLLAAKATWAADGHAFAIEAPSAAFLEGARLMAATTLVQEGA